MLKKILLAAFGASLPLAPAAHASAVVLETFASPGVTYTSVNLGSTVGNNWVTNMPLSLNYSGMTLNIDYGSGGVVARDISWNPTPGQNYIRASDWIDMQFSSAISHLSLYWSSPSAAEQLAFYNGNTLVDVVTSQEFRDATGVAAASTGAYINFNLSNLGVDRVYATTSATWLEFGGLKFAQQPEPAPIPAGGLGGLAALLLVGAWRRGRMWARFSPA